MDNQKNYSRTFTAKQLDLIGESIFAKTMVCKKAARELQPSSAASFLKEQIQELNDVFDLIMGDRADMLIGRLCSPFDD